MQFKFIFAILLPFWLNVLSAQNSFERALYYAILTGNDPVEIDRELNTLKRAPDKEAFRGALLMKKSGLMKDVKEKLKLFKEGHKALEQSIHNDSTNTEYRFLRLVIQENAPKIVNYNKDIKQDASYLRKNYDRLPLSLQKVVLNYCKNSKALKPEDFKH